MIKKPKFIINSTISVQKTKGYVLYNNIYYKVISCDFQDVILEYINKDSNLYQFSTVPVDCILEWEILKFPSILNFEKFYDENINNVIS